MYTNELVFKAKPKSYDHGVDAKFFEFLFIYFRGFSLMSRVSMWNSNFKVQNSQFLEH